MNNQKQFPKKQPKFPATKETLKVIPLGGIGDVTKNMYVYEYNNNILVVDCGIGFPDEGMPGIDLVIPDIKYLRERKSQIRGIIISHPHEDHIGGLPFIWPELNCPIYAQRLAVGFIRAKFNEFHLPKDKIQTVNLNSQLNLGPFKVSFYQVSHSVPDSTGLIIETPTNRVIHQADFKLDWTPVNGQTTDLGKVALAAGKGIDLMLIDSLGVEKRGYTLSEKTIQPTFANIESATSGKVIITTTSSNISRIQQAINVAVAVGRKVALVGRSMESNFQVAWDLGYLNVPAGAVIAPEEIKRFPDNKLMVIIAGSQGQPGSSLSRLANNDHRMLKLSPNDAVVFSADPIPNSETAQHSLIDRLTKIGVDVYYTAITDDLHVSGHGAAEEIKIMISVAKPKYLLPIGATFRHMRSFSRMAQNMGWRKDQVLMVEDGSVVNVGQGKTYVDGRVETENIYVDGLGVGDVGNVVLRDRIVMAEEGIVLVVVPMSAHSGQPTGEPDIISRGFIFEKEAEGLLFGAKQVVKEALSDHQGASLDWRFARRHISESLEQYFYKQTQRRPLILPVVVEV